MLIVLWPTNNNVRLCCNKTKDKSRALEHHVDTEQMFIW